MDNYRDSYRHIREKYNTKYLAAQQRAEARRAELRLKIPGFAELDRKLGAVGSEIMLASLDCGGDREQKLAEIRERNERLQRQRKELILKSGYPADYADVKYDCPICDDSGYVDGRMCRCMRQELIMAGYEASGISRLLERQTFENFSLDYYSGTAREIMASNVGYLERYSKNFNPSSASDASGIFMLGGTGLGKTHLSSAVARRIIEKGYYVLYVSASGLFEEYNRKTFGAKGAEADTDKYSDCDLLIIDDLGTELTNQFTVSCLYNLINTRMNLGKQTIISTNLSEQKLREKYDDRIFSRIFGEFTVLMFAGSDIRMKKRQK